MEGDEGVAVQRAPTTGANQDDAQQGPNRHCRKKGAYRRRGCPCAHGHGRPQHAVAEVSKITAQCCGGLVLRALVGVSWSNIHLEPGRTRAHEWSATGLSCARHPMRHGTSKPGQTRYAGLCPGGRRTQSLGRLLRQRAPWRRPTPRA